MIDWNKRNGGFLSPESVYEDQLGNLSQQINEKDKEIERLKDKLYGKNEYIKILEKSREDYKQRNEKAIEFMKENCDIITLDNGWIVRSELTTTGLWKLFKILNKGEQNEKEIKTETVV